MGRAKLLELLRQAAASLEAEADLVRLQEFFIHHQLQAPVTFTGEDLTCQGLALQFAVEHAMPETCQLVLHYFDKSTFTDDPICWLLQAPAVASGEDLPLSRPMLCQYNRNRVARVLFSFGWQLPVSPSSAQLLSISDDMRHFQSIQQLQGASRTATDELVPRPVVAIKRLPFRAVGHQGIAADIKGAFYAHSMYLDDQPLVLMFAGPCGRGKTRMAHDIASLLQEDSLCTANSIVIPCGSISSKQELFGLAGTYGNSHIDSALNKFIRQHQCQSGVVILDEFEKLDADAQEGFLEPFDTGDSYCI